MDLTARKHEYFDLVLAASARSKEIPDSEDIYGWLIGSWELQVIFYRTVDVTTLDLKGEAHFAWVLEGRAIQDVWIMPRLENRTQETDKTNNMYGTTLRVWNPSIQGWSISWSNPVRNHHEEQIGRRIDDEIVQLGARTDGTPTRWRFKEITKNSFRWIGEVLLPDGRTWLMETEFLAKRSVPE